MVIFNKNTHGGLLKMGLRSKVAKLICIGGAMYCLAEGTDNRNLDFNKQYCNITEMKTSLQYDNHANVIGAVGFDACAIGAIIAVATYNKSKR